MNYIHFAHKKTGLNTRLPLITWAKDFGLDDPIKRIEAEWAFVQVAVQVLQLDGMNLSPRA